MFPPILNYLRLLTRQSIPIYLILNTNIRTRIGLLLHFWTGKMTSVTIYSFHTLWLSKRLHLLSAIDHAKVTHVFVSSELNYCNVLNLRLKVKAPDGTVGSPSSHLSTMRIHHRGPGLFALVPSPILNPI